MTASFMALFPSDVGLGDATPWAPCHLFNEGLGLISTLAHALPVSVDVPAHQCVR
jgi:hypothetical protein